MVFFTEPMAGRWPWPVSFSYPTVTYFLKELPPPKHSITVRAQFQLSRVFPSSPAIAIELPLVFQAMEFILELCF